MRSMFLLILALAFIGHIADAAIVEKCFHITDTNFTLGDYTKSVTVVNKTMPGPDIHVTEGDTLIVHVINNSNYSMTIHWHGIFQRQSCWMDGASMATQCPIQPGSTFTHNFTITDQRGTLWWHSHISMHRATVYGALIIDPKPGSRLPYRKPDAEAVILLGEWWNEEMAKVANAAHLQGLSVRSDNYTINGKPARPTDSPNDEPEMYELPVEKGKTYLLRIINAAVNAHMFFKVAGHSFTVVAVDGSYTNHYDTDLVATSSGQTVDVLMVANATEGAYYMAASSYERTDDPPCPAKGLVRYESSSSSSSSTPGADHEPQMPTSTDTDAFMAFHFHLTGLELVQDGIPTPVAAVPLQVDRCLFMAFGMGRLPCETDQTQCVVNATVGQINNISFVMPAEDTSSTSLLQAHYEGREGGVYTSDFPCKPRLLFVNLYNPGKGTKLKKFTFNETVEIVVQNQATGTNTSHPMHLHGHKFFILAQGYGNYDPTADPDRYNLVNPLVRNTVAVPSGGWAVIRFTANNPGVWLFHCHMDNHLEVGLAMAFIVLNGTTPDTSLPPPPPGYPECPSSLPKLRAAEAADRGIN